MGIVSVRYFEFPSAVDGVGSKTVQSLDFGIARTAAEILLGNSPKRVAANHGVDAVFLCGIDVCAVRGKNKVAGVLICFCLCVGKDAVSPKLTLLVRPRFTDTVVTFGELCGIHFGRCLVLFLLGGEKSFDVGSEGIHTLAVPRKPMHHVTVIGGDAFLVALAMADDVLFGETVLLTKISKKLYRFGLYGFEISGIGKSVLANLKADVGIVCRTACVPSTVIPRQGLISYNRTVIELADESVNADLSTAGVVGVPMVVVSVFAEFAVIGTDVTFQPGVICPGGMHHNAFNGYLPIRFVTSVFGEYQRMQIHITRLLSVCS